MDNVIKLKDGRQLTLREAASNSSVSRLQGYQRCHCKTGRNNKCIVPVVGLESCVTVNDMAVQLVKINNNNNTYFYFYLGTSFFKF